MAIGLKCGSAELHNHDPEWEKLAAETIQRLRSILGDAAGDIQHVGSTAIPAVKAEPIIDIAAAVRDFDEVTALLPVLKENGFILLRGENHDDESMLFACGDCSEPDGIITHFIFAVKADSAEMKNCCLFRDYMNTHCDDAKSYESLKVRLMSENPIDPGREKYLAGKKDFIAAKLGPAQIWDEFCRRFTKIEPVRKGWSSDKKYYAETADKEQFLIRTADISQYEHKKTEFENMKKAAASGIPMQQPAGFGVCSDGTAVFLLLTWIDGEDAEKILPLLPEREQYVLGIKAGEILKQIQTAEVLPPSDDWFIRYGAKIDSYIQNYRDCGLSFEGDELLTAYIEQTRHAMKNRPMCLTHDDYHPGNMILTKEHELFVIDFQRLRTAEPFHAMSGLVFSGKYSPHFASGQIRGYFGGEPSENFWELLKLYFACIAVNALPWSVPFGQDETDFAYMQITDVLAWYDNMKAPVPAWYLKDFHIQ